LQAERDSGESRARLRSRAEWLFDEKDPVRRDAIAAHHSTFCDKAMARGRGSSA
jgi:hypothetical protein